MKTVVAEDGHAAATVAAQNHSDRAVTVSGDVGISFDGSQTVAFEDEFSETAAEAPRPPAESLEDFDVVTNVVDQPESPFDSQDEVSGELLDGQHEVMTKTVIEEDARSLREQKRASSPDVLSRTVVEAAAVEAAAVAVARSESLDSSTPPITSAVATPAGGRPSDVLPRPMAAQVPHPPRVPLPGMTAADSVPPSSAASAVLTMPSPAEVVAASALVSPAPQGMGAGMSPTPQGMLPSPPSAAMAGAAVVPFSSPQMTPAGVPLSSPLLPPVSAISLPLAGPVAADPAMQIPSDYALPHAGAPPQGGHAGAPPQGGHIGPPPDMHELPDPRMPVPTPANAVWKAAHPSAQAWATKRQGQAVRAPKSGVIALGLMLVGLGGYLLAIFLPSKAPLTASQLQRLASQAGVDEKAWRFTDELLGAANLNATLFIVLGLVLVFRGAFHRQHAGPAAQGMSKSALMLSACFVVLAASFAALVLSSTS